MQSFDPISLKILWDRLVSIADEPLSCVALGTGRVLEDMKHFKDKEVFYTAY